ncbi:MAG: DUF2312 domain-containing protein [Terriglobia bacterium]|nr:DUF2312 domain-containing protein [Terriglobia bacterium]
MAKAGFAKEHLKAFIDRIVRLETEKEALGDDIKEVYSEAKGNGFDTKVMRRIIKLMQLDKADLMEADAIEDLYRRAVDLPPVNG